MSTNFQEIIIGRIQPITFITSFYSTTRVIGNKELSDGWLMMLINENNRVNLFITFLKHGYHKDSTVIGSYYQGWMIYGSISNRICHFFIWEEKLKLMFVIDVLDYQWVKVDGTVLNCLRKYCYVINEERNFVIICNIIRIVQVF